MPRTFSLDTYTSTLRDIGWIDALPRKEQRALLNDLRGIFKRSKASELPSTKLFLTLSITSFDTEMINGSGPKEPCSYYSAIEQLAKASFGYFKPTKIHDELDDEAEIARISFEIKKKRFAIAVPYMGDWFDGNVIEELINGALETIGVAHRFCVLPAVDQCANVAFVPLKIHRRAERKGLIPTQEDVFAEYPI